MGSVESKLYTATVSQVNKFIKQMVDKTPVLNNICIKGEISNFKRHFSGHCYLTLKDDGGVLRAVMFKGVADKLGYEPENGMKVLAAGRISVYERDGAYQLYIEDLKRDGLGSLYEAYEKLKKQLESEGLFDASHKKPIPKFPKTVGVVTAKTGAAVRDIINVLNRRYPYAKVVLYPSLVQGENAAKNVCEAIEYFNEKNLADVLIVGRGGGSIEDLWAFNEEITARAIYNSKIPVISAVGHETDFTIADFVSDLRAPTPSAAAELAVPSAAELKNRFNDYLKRLVLAQKSVIVKKRSSLERIKLKNVDALLDDYRLRFDNLLIQAQKSMKIVFERKKKILVQLSARMEAMSPLAVLSRGYSIAVDNDKNVIKSVNDINKDDEFELILSDGSKKCRVEE